MTEPFHAWPDISIGGSPLSAELGQQLDQVLVDHHQHLPDMFVITFQDPGRDILSQAGATIGATVVIKVTPPGGSSPETLINGEITSLEAEYHAHRTRSIIRGYDKSHRMHRGRRTETYKNVTDSDIARKVAQRAGLTIGQIDSTSGTFDLVSQANQSDWDFLKSRAREIGYELSMGDEFAGKYTLTSARHVFADGGYRTHFAVSGRQDRTLLGLTSLGSSNGHASAGGAPINGVVVAVVTDNNDPNNLARVKLKFPWLDDSYESDWARLAQLGAGPNSGALWIPEVNDEGLVAFEHGDIRRPYVVGNLYNGVDKPNEGSGLFDNG